MAAQRASDYDPLSFVDVDVVRAAPAGADGAASAAPPLDDDFADARSSMYASATPNAPHMHASATTSGGADAHMYASATSAASNTSHVSAMYQSATGTSTAAATGAPPAGGVDHRHSGSSRNDSNSSNNGNGGAYNGAYAPHGASPAGNGGGGSGGGASFTYPPSLPPPQQQSTLTPAPPQQQQQQQQQRQGYPSVPPAGGSLHTSVDGGNAFAGGGLGFGGGFGGVGVGLGGVALAYSVTVGEPQKAVGATAIPGLGDGTYAAYPITSTRLGTGLGASGDSVQVLRRFKDVVALSDLLEDLFPGHFVPPRPRRNAVQGRRMQPGFLEARRAALERFLTRCACHPAVSSSEALSLFLTSHGDLRAAPAWQAMCGGASARGDGGHWRGAKTLLAGLVGLPPPVRNADEVTACAVQAHPDVYRRLGERLAAARGTLRNMPVSPLEASLRSEGETLAGAQVSLVEAARCARAVSSATGAVADARAGLSRALNVLASYEADCGKQGHGNPGRAAAVVAQGCAKSAELSALAVQHSDAQLALLDDYACYLPNAAGAMSRREGALLMLVQLEADLSQRRAKLADAMDKPAMFAKRAGMQSAVATLEGAVHAARAEYDAVSQINAQELVALRASMRADLASALRQFVLIQVANNQKAAQLWEETLAALPL